MKGSSELHHPGIAKNKMVENDNGTIHLHLHAPRNHQNAKLWVTAYPYGNDLQPTVHHSKQIQQCLPLLRLVLLWR